jgi:class 3 adenylate cyclase/tetratricopeptide (TPR) repeat protein
VRGTVVFADVSGFTALSERLARRGRGGAEELTDLINAVVSRMLAVSRPLGGDLLKYGGDALLLLFTDTGHERRAAAAAAAMQQGLRDFRSFASESGRVRLEMSIGVETGTVEAFLVGVHHRELFVAGPTVSRVVRLQELAGPGQIIVGKVAAGALPEAWLGKPVAENAGLLRTRVRISAPGVDDVQPFETGSEAHALVGVPRALQARLGGVDGEHRQVAVGFVQCGGLDDMLRGDGPESLAQALNTLAEAAMANCDDHGVTFLATDVGVSSAKLVFVAGAPITSADDEDRMLAVLRAVLDVPTPLRVKAGVHRGRAFAVEVGDDQRRVYTVLGDTVNLAARMMAAAPEDGILATAPVFERLRIAYSREATETFQVKGVSEPVEAALVGRLEPLLPATRLAELPFVGRQAELAVLQDAIESARTGKGRVIEVVGEPGIGKSRLLAEALADVGELPTVVIQARQYAKAEPYAAVRGPLRRLLGAAAADESDVVRLLSDRVSELVPEVEPLLPLIGVPFGLRLPDTDITRALAADHRREELRAATIRLLVRLFPESGVLAIEDPYWLDEGSGHLLARLAGVLPGWAVFVAQRVSTPRLDLSGVSDVVQMELNELPAQAAEQLASATGKLTTEETAALAQRSNGNPLFLEELAAAVAGGAAIDELPDTVEAVIAAHLDTLDPPERDLARIASVLGSDFPTRLLFDLAEVDPESGRATLERLAGVLAIQNGSTRFAHALLRESAYEGLSYRRRRALHGKAGDLIRSGLPEAGGRERRAALLSLHYSLAKRHRDCWEWSLIAAERARHDAAPVEAVAFLSRALDSAKAAGVEPAGIASVHEQLGDLAELAGIYAKAADAYRRARRLRVYDPVAAAGLLRKQGHVAEREGRYQVALQLYARGFRALEKAASSETEERVRVELTMASGATRLRQGRYPDAIRDLEEAGRLAELHADLPSLAHAYYLLDWAHTDLGRPDPRYRALALPIYEELGDWLGQGNVLNNLGADAFYEGRWSDALEFYRRSRDACERVGATVMAAAAIHNIGETLCEQGYFREARIELSHALETWKLSGYPGASMAAANLGRLVARTGDFEKAEELLTGAMTELGRIGAESAVVDVEMREVERRVLMGDGAAALELALAVRGRAEQPVQQAFLDQMIGWARAQLGEYDAARAAFYASLRTAQQVGARYEEARTRSALARLASLRVGEVATDIEAEQILAGLGVIWTPLPPL